MKITATADLHGYLPNAARIAPCDVFVLAGDYEVNRDRRVSLGGYKRLWQWLEGIDAKHILCVAGNHDFLLQNDLGLALEGTETLDGRFHYLQDAGVVIDGVKFWGSPWTPPFFNWAFMKPESDLVETYGGMTLFEPDVLITHGPAHGTVGLAPNGYDCGSRALRQAIKIAQPKLHLCGHIHHCQGRTTWLNDTLCGNVAYVDETYYPKQTPLMFELNAEGGVDF